MFNQTSKCAVFISIMLLSSGCAVEPEGQEGVAVPVGNPITGEGLPNPTPNVTANWGILPKGRVWGSTAGIDVDPIDRHIWAYERCSAGNFGAGVPVNAEGNVWVTDFAGNADGTKGHQVHKFGPDGELMMSLGTAGQKGSGPNQFNQPIDVITAPDGSIFVADGHNGQSMTTY